MSCEVILAGGLKVERRDGSATEAFAGDEASTRAAALAAVVYGDYEATLEDYIRGIDNILSNRHGMTTISNSCMNFFDGGYVFVERSKMRFSLKGPRLPVRIVYDIMKTLNGEDPEVHLADQEFTLRTSVLEEKEVEIPLIESTDPSLIQTYMDHVRAFFCPYHL